MLFQKADEVAHLGLSGVNSRAFGDLIKRSRLRVSFTSETKVQLDKIKMLDFISPIFDELARNITPARARSRASAACAGQR
jgi:hypothetical protein